MASGTTSSSTIIPSSSTTTTYKNWIRLNAVECHVILSMLSLSDQCRLARTSKAWHRHAKHPHVLNKIPFVLVQNVWDKIEDVDRFLQSDLGRSRLIRASLNLWIYDDVSDQNITTMVGWMLRYTERMEDIYLRHVGRLLLYRLLYQRLFCTDAVRWPVLIAVFAEQYVFQLNRRPLCWGNMPQLRALEWHDTGVRCSQRNTHLWFPPLTTPLHDLRLSEEGASVRALQAMPQIWPTLRRLSLSEVAQPVPHIFRMQLTALQVVYDIHRLVEWKFAEWPHLHTVFLPRCMARLEADYPHLLAAFRGCPSLTVLVLNLWSPTNAGPFETHRPYLEQLFEAIPTLQRVYFNNVALLEWQPLPAAWSNRIFCSSNSRHWHDEKSI